MKRIVIAVACLFVLSSLPIQAKKILLKKSKPDDPSIPTRDIPVDADYEDGRLYIDFKQPGGVAQVNVKGRFGMVVSDWVDTQATSTHVIDATMLDDGQYMLEVEYEGQAVEGKFEVE